MKKKHKAKNLINSVKEDAAFAILAPLKLAMQSILKSYNIQPKSKKLKDIANAFYVGIVKKGNSYESHYEGHSDSYESDCYECKVNRMTGADSYENDSFIPPQAIEAAGAIIAGIIHWFKKKKEDKEAGKQLSPAEEKALALADEGAKTADEYKKDETNSAIGEFVTDNALFIVLGILALIFLLKK